MRVRVILATLVAAFIVFPISSMSAGATHDAEVYGGDSEAYVELDPWEVNHDAVAFSPHVQTPPTWTTIDLVVHGKYSWDVSDFSSGCPGEFEECHASAYGWFEIEPDVVDPADWQHRNEVLYSQIGHYVSWPGGAFCNQGGCVSETEHQLIATAHTWELAADGTVDIPSSDLAEVEFRVAAGASSKVGTIENPDNGETRRIGTMTVGYDPDLPIVEDPQVFDDERSSLF